MLGNPVGQTQKAAICKQNLTAMQTIPFPLFEFQTDDHFQLLEEHNEALHVFQFTEELTGNCSIN